MNGRLHKASKLYAFIYIHSFQLGTGAAEVSGSSRTNDTLQEGMKHGSSFIRFLCRIVLTWLQERLRGPLRHRQPFEESRFNQQQLGL